MKECPVIEAVIAIVVFVALSILLTSAVVGKTTGDYWMDAAVKAGKAEYYLDENNNKQWRWK